MKIEILGKGVEIDRDLRRFVEHRVDFALSTRADHIDSVLVHLADIGTPDDPGDKSCLVHVRLHGLADVCVENTDANLNLAVHRAVDRAGWTAARKILRQHRTVIASLFGEPLPGGLREPERAA